MSLIICPECGTEISAAAVACPNCGRPMRSIPIVKEVVPIREEEREVPKWVIIPLAVIFGLVIVLAFVLLYRSGDDDANVNLKVNASRTGGNRDVARSDTVVESAPGSVSTVPGSSTTVNPPVSSVNPPATTTVPGTSTGVAPPTRGSVTVDAKIANRNGNGTSPVRNARFYLLDKDVESILSEANVEPIEGQTLMSSLGLAAAFPSTGDVGDPLACEGLGDLEQLGQGGVFQCRAKHVLPVCRNKQRTWFCTLELARDDPAGRERSESDAAAFD